MTYRILIAVLLAVIATAQPPQFFDARTYWPNCFKQVSDQKTCPSTSAQALAGLMSDRYCIQNKNIVLSPQSLICANVTNCGDAVTDTLIKAEFAYANANGLPTAQCIPYTGNTADCPANNNSCKAIGVNYTAYKCGVMSYETDLTKIKTEIMTNGPVMCLFTPTKDYPDYYDGVYYPAH